MSTKRVFALFPGQGSQRVGMGKELCESSNLAKELFKRADEALGFSLSQLCFEGPEEKLTATENAQPAILTVSTICLEIAKEQAGAQLNIVGAAGHSLGEYSALVAAGAIAFEDAVRIVNRRGSYMQSAVPVGTGKMVAVLGKEVSIIEESLAKVTAGVAEIANVNAPGQVVVSGARAAIDEFMQIIGGKVIELQVSAPFHCSLMQPAAQKLALDLDALTIKPANFPVYANAWAKTVRTPEEIRAALKDQVCGRVRWVESMERALQEITPDVAVEFGAGNVLSGLLKRISSQVPRAECGSVAQAQALSSLA